MSVEPAKPRRIDTVRTGFRFRDFVVVVLCLSIVFLGINLFRQDLSRTINLQNVEPVGTITIKHNIVQRRIADRVLWDRLAVQSPVYLGDLIRVPALSSATLNIEGLQIDLDENTLIRIQLSPAGDGALQIELSEGSIGLITTAESGIQISMMGHVIDTAPGTTLSASAGSEGMAVQVNEGAAVFVEEGGGREIAPGTMIALDNQGVEKLLPAVVVTFPRPNARYVKSGYAPVAVGFSWNPVNFLPEDSLSLVVAADRNFSRSVQLFENLDVSAEIVLEAGLWNWRLSGVFSGNETILASGRLTVVEASGIELTSPARGSLFSYYDETPSVRFQWTEIEEASNYIVEISSAPDFANPRANLNTVAPFLVETGLDTGTWYWRVKPVFSSAYEGSAAFSPFSFFHIEQSFTEVTAAITIPDPEPEPVPEPEPIPPVPLEIRLFGPVQGAILPGLQALREQTVFTWQADREVRRSRFVLSRNRNPLDGRPVVETANPNNAVRVNSIEEGTWYWTIEAESFDGLVSVAEVRTLQVLPIPLLPAPQTSQPSNGQRIGIEQLRTQSSIAFSWSTVQGANGYILTLFQQSASGRRQIISTQLGSQTRWVLDNINLLSPGTFVWHVEAVNTRNNVIEQRGNIRENSFIIDIPSPSVRLENPGALYGF